MKTYYLTILVLFSIISCSYEKENNKDSIKLENYTDIIPLEFIASSFDFPINKPNAKGYYNAQKFKENTEKNNCQ